MLSGPLAPGAELSSHTSPVSTSITLLSGRARLLVDGREYTLEPGDNAVIASEQIRAVWTATDTEGAVFHLALASDALTHVPVPECASQRLMPRDFPGVPGAERINRFATSPRSAAGPNTEFIDFFNDALIPGITMSGGYGLFHPGGRLPAHVHDFDESICITSGRATCVVEGRRYAMSDGATALQPRGRVHYFINESNGPMEMLWVYAGPRPERIVVDERCATLEGDPWR